MIFGMLLAVLLVSLVVTLALGFYVLVSAPDEAINRTFAAFVGMMILWIVKDLAFWGFHGADADASWWGVVSFLIGIGLQFALLLFAEVFPENKRPRWSRLALLAAPMLAFLPLLLGGAMWRQIGYVGGHFHVSLTPAAYAFGLYNHALLVTGVVQLARKYRQHRGTLWGKQLAAVILGVVVTGALIVPSGTLLPAVGVYALLPFTSAFIVVGTLIYAYAITNFQLFSLETALSRLRLFPLTYKVTIAVMSVALLGFFLLQVPVALWSFGASGPGPEAWKRFLVFSPVVGLVPSLILILVIVKILSRPLGALTEKTLEVARGSYGAQVEITSNDELGVLARSFNVMSRQMAADIARLKEINQALIRTEKLATAGTLAAGVAHEVNNPLASISSLVQSLLARAGDERERETLRLILNQITRITSVLRGLMDFARPKQPQRALAQLDQIILKSIELARYDKRFKQIAVRTEFAAHLPPLALDSDQIQQVFLNLLLNARDALEGRDGAGEIRVTTAWDGREVTAEVIDDGSGVAPEHAGRLFDPFFTTKPAGKGTGLGLAVSHSIITAHGGRISVTPLAAGTRVTVAFPLEKQNRER
jgi:signal transduction histidine kinase